MELRPKLKVLMLGDFNTGLLSQTRCFQTASACKRIADWIKTTLHTRGATLCTQRSHHLRRWQCHRAGKAKVGGRANYLCMQMFVHVYVCSYVSVQMYVCMNVCVWYQSGIWYVMYGIIKTYVRWYVIRSWYMAFALWLAVGHDAQTDVYCEY